MRAPPVRLGRSGLGPGCVKTVNGFFAPYYEGLSAVERLMALGSGTLHPQFFPKTLMVDMFKFGQGKSFFIDTVGKAISYSVNVTGIREPQDFGDVSLEMLCDVCDNANHQNGQCVRESMQRDLSFGSYMNVSHVTVSFLKPTFAKFRRFRGQGSRF